MPRPVATDATVIINLCHAQRLDLMSQLGPWEFVVPGEVKKEIKRPEQQALLADAIDHNHLRLVPITDLQEITTLAGLSRFLGKGEAACLTLAQHRGWHLASDEKGPFRREVDQRVGQQRLITTPGLLVMAIRRGVLTVDDADAVKQVLAQNRFRMKFNSFRDVV